MQTVFLEVAEVDGGLGLRLEPQIVAEWAERTGRVVPLESAWAVVLRDPLVVFAEHDQPGEGLPVMLARAGFAAVDMRIFPAACPGSGSPLFSLWFEDERVNYRVDAGLDAEVDIRVMACIVAGLEQFLDSTKLRTAILAELARPASVDPDRLH